ncbi:carbohydrate sulfotransferase 3 [Hyalella azteca]|uniref:Carbohydrate sulfotransferase 3 n=1 Tax=Hyalella azteca TaxID=294128 RepID=A0A8B7MYT9_HYAAZ|nr:carbohydrate sulfotransferase 3 [Hyalella azteca]
MGILRAKVMLSLGVAGMLVMAAIVWTPYGPYAFIPKPKPAKLSISNLHEAETVMHEHEAASMPKSAAQQQPGTPSASGPKLVLLLSSTPRSGSSFIGELLATYKPTAVYFFEPLHKIQELPCMLDNSCVSNYLGNIFSCDLDNAFQQWLRSKSVFFQFFSQTSKSCGDKSSNSEIKSCFSKIDMINECLQADVRLIKVIRSRIHHIVPLLNSLPHIKVVHLYRDPRGFMNSINKFTNWNHNSSKYCENLNNDLLDFRILSEKHPQQMIQIAYENFSNDPTEGTKKLFNFVYGNATLEAPTLSYLESHTKFDSNGPMTTLKNSGAAAEAWRNTISIKTLGDVEHDLQCRQAVRLMNHTIFNSIENARNRNIPLELHKV